MTMPAAKTAMYIPIVKAFFSISSCVLPDSADFCYYIATFDEYAIIAEPARVCQAAKNACPCVLRTKYCENIEDV
jgi:hypothetical protein